MAIGVPTTNLPFLWRLVPHLLGAAQVFLPNGISFRPEALAGCLNVTDIWTGYVQIRLLQ